MAAGKFLRRENDNLQEKRKKREKRKQIKDWNINDK